jgi:hypothetical protein
MGMGMGMGGGKKAAVGGSDRSAWKPVGDKARDGFDAGAKEEAKKKAEDQGLQRTEFHIFFVWEEPTPSELGTKAKKGP